MKLRYYQEEAIDSCRDYLRNNPDKNPLIVLPTGAGKTPVIASICKGAVDKGRRVLILSHRAELLKQNRNHAVGHESLSDKVGLFSAGLNQRDTEHSIIVAGIQSVYRRMSELGKFDIIMIDEAHLVSEREDSMYQQLMRDALKMNPAMRVIGLTATPYRTGTGFMCHENNTFQGVCYDVCVADLIEQGFLCPIKSKGGLDKATIDMTGSRVVRGDYVDGEMSDKAMADGMVSAAVEDMIQSMADRNKVLVFSINVEHGREIANAIRRRTSTANCLEIYGDSIDRDESLSRFTNDPQARFLVNCNILTTGFDYPAIDGVVLLRPTVSPGLYYQMVGRGLRLHDSKDDCLVLDYGNNIKRHGPINAINPGLTGYRGDVVEAQTKQCPSCGEVVMATRTVCPDCGEQFVAEKRETSHAIVAASDQIIAKKELKTERHRVNLVRYNTHQKSGSAIKTLRVDYHYGIIGKVSEWVCLEHEGYALKKAREWWREHTYADYPDGVADAMERIPALRQWEEWQQPYEIEVETGGQYPSVKKRIFQQEAKV